MAINRYTNISTATTTLVKSGPGKLVRIIVNLHIASNAITVYDALTAVAPTIATITPATIVTNPPISVEYDLDFNTGLTIVTAGAANLTVVWR